MERLSPRASSVKAPPCVHPGFLRLTPHGRCEAFLLGCTGLCGLGGMPVGMAGNGPVYTCPGLYRVQGKGHGPVQPGFASLGSAWSVHSIWAKLCPPDCSLQLRGGGEKYDFCPPSIWWRFKLTPQRDSQWGSRRTDKHGSTYGLSELPPPKCDSLLPCRAPGVKGEESLCGYYQLGSARKGPWPCCLAPLKEQPPFFALAYLFIYFLAELLCPRL